MHTDHTCIHSPTLVCNYFQNSQKCSANSTKSCHLPVWLYAHRSEKLKSLHEQWAAYAAETDKERQKLEQDKADLKKQEATMRASLQAEFDKKKNELQEVFDKKQEELQRKFDILEAERRDWDEEKERVKQTKVFEEVVTVDVGGTKYRTFPSTLTEYPDSMLGVMFSGRHNLPQQEDGSYFINRDGEVFKYILMYLRDRDLCFNYLHDDGLNNKQGQPSPLKSSLLKLVAHEAQYFQLRELETKARIVLNLDRGQCTNAFGFSTHQIYRGGTYWSNPQKYDLDYVQDKLQCQYFTNQNITFKHHIVKVVCKGETGSEFKQKITFDSCDLSGVTFCNCYFQEGVSFEGCILHGTKFERVGGLVRHKVHFTPWQVAQADFEPKLLQALKDNGCIY